MLLCFLLLEYRSTKKVFINLHILLKKSIIKKNLEITSLEYEVLQSISLFDKPSEIANKLFLSESTIKTHLSNLLVKLNAELKRCK
ncbi:LuxR C-terminal-related transcriptional regulator [Algibacter sp.]|nr:LuxR C-terminal-related transcriptional regulator [Algibacter sp.]MDC1226443.1 LuxR C-terminal-related transcriptional regulator [Algibacter sp.]MDC1364957.1 LuxR C-terminal-related transcriptional regulator [Algibacter sp.]